MEMERTHEFLPEEFFDACGTWWPSWSTKSPRLLPVWQEITEGNGPRYAPPEQQYTWPATYLSPHRCWNEELSRGVARSRLRVRLQGLEDEGQEEGEEERAEHTNTGSMHGSWELNAACT